MSDTDVLGAYGMADRRLSNGIEQYSKHPLAVPLSRLFTGDKTSALEIVRILSGIIRNKALNKRIPITQIQSRDMAKAILGWFQHPRCKVCGGHGFKLIKNTKTIGDVRCKPCNATGTVQLEMLYPADFRELVRWAIARMEMEAGLAAPAAMRAIASEMDL